jgi:hypothetical protein
MVRKNLDFDKAEILLYEPVEKMPPFSRKTLVLVKKYNLQFEMVPISELLSLLDPNTSS